MDNETKIHLSPFEMDLLNNSDWILTKNRIIKKAQQLLGQVQENVFDYTQQHKSRFPAEVIAISPKISRGENYNGLPWLMLDYPRYFDKENVFAIRTMFWWGNFFSTTLHLSGAYKQKYHRCITEAYEALCENEFYYCVNPEPWQHHFETTNYSAVKTLSSQEFMHLISAGSFAKLACRFPLTEWNNAIKILSENFARIINWLG